MENDKKQMLYNMYNATSTDDGTGNDELETYENWLERQLISRIEKIEKLNLHNVSKPYYKGKWYYFGKCKPYPVQVDGYPVKPYKQFDTKEECQSYIDSAC